MSVSRERDSPVVSAEYGEAFLCACGISIGGGVNDRIARSREFDRSRAFDAEAEDDVESFGEDTARRTTSELGSLAIDADIDIDASCPPRVCRFRASGRSGCESE